MEWGYLSEMNLLYLLAIPLLLVSCKETLFKAGERAADKEIKIQESINAEFAKQAYAKDHADDIKDFADAVDAENENLKEAERNLLEVFQQWVLIKDGTARATTILSMNKDEQENYLSLLVFQDGLISGTVLSYQHRSVGGSKKVISPAKVELLLDRVERVEVFMQPANGDLVLLGPEVKDAVEFANQVLIRITQANGDDFVYKFNTKGFPYKHFVTKIGGE